MSSNKSISSLEFTKISPDSNFDWINKRNDIFSTFTPLIQEKGESKEGIFNVKSVGIGSNRDYWVYGFSKDSVNNNMQRMVRNYNSEVDRLKEIKDSEEKVSLIKTEDSFISWSRGLKNKLIKGEKISLDNDNLVQSLYRPFTKKWLYFDKQIIEMPSTFKKYLGEHNQIILVPGVGGKKDFSVFITDNVTNLQALGFASKVQCFYRFNNESANDWLEINNSNINTNIVNEMGISDDELFYLVYGILHSKDYIKTFSNDLKKVTPRIPNLKNKDMYIKIGEQLADIHLNYESVAPYDDLEIITKNSNPSLYGTVNIFV